MLILPTRRIAGSERSNGTTSKVALSGGGAEQESGRAMTILAHVCRHTFGEGGMGTIYSRSIGADQYITLGVSPANSAAFRFTANSTGSSITPRADTSTRMWVNARAWQHVGATWDGGTAGSGINLYTALDGEPLTRDVANQFSGSGSIVDSSSAVVCVGNRDDSARTWDGWIHYVARWDRVLDLSELLLAQRYGPEAVINGLVMLYRDGRDWSPIGLSVTSTDILGGPAPSVRSMARRVPTFYSAGGGGTTYDVSISESVSASDSLSASAAFGGALAEAVSAADALAAVATLAGDLSEAASASDVVSAAAAYAGALSEATSAADAMSSTAQMAGELSESVSASDSIDGSIGAATYAAELVESVSASDSLTAAAVYASAIVEAVTAQDAVTASAVLGAVLAEVASASDSVGAALVLAAAISEAVSAADGWSGSVGSQVFEVELSEAVSASDAWVALGVLARHGVRGAKAVQTQMSTRANVQTARRYN